MIYSLTPFLNEYEILEIRLSTLADVVDVHILGVANETHSGKPNTITDRDRLAELIAPFFVRVVSIDLSHRHTDYGREKEHRRQLAREIFDFRDDDKILLSDLDEIPHPDAVQAASFHTLPCWMHVAKLNWRWTCPPKVNHQICRVFPGSYLLDGGNLEEARLQHMPLLGAPNGWHLSWMGDMNTKLDAWVDQPMRPYARPDLAARGGNLFPGCGTDADHGIEWVDLDQLPPHVAENKERYAHMMADRP